MQSAQTADRLTPVEPFFDQCPFDWAHVQTGMTCEVPVGTAGRVDRANVRATRGVDNEGSILTAPSPLLMFRC